jgi:hypothetical protein
MAKLVFITGTLKNGFIGLKKRGEKAIYSQFGFHWKTIFPKTKSGFYILRSNKL